MIQFKEYLDKINYLFSSKNFDDLKERLKFLKSKKDILSPIIIKGNSCDKLRTRISIIEENKKYYLDNYQSIKIMSFNDKVNHKVYSKNKNIWVIFHGFADCIGGDFINIANNIAKNHPEDYVFALDWKEIADGASPAFCMDVCRTSTWINTIANEFVNKLEKWGVNNPNKINLIGHSLGSLMAMEIANILKLKQNNLINSIIALDPPSELSTRSYNPSCDCFITNLNPLILRQKSLKGLANSTIAIVGNNSIAGNEKIARSANYSYLIRFNKILEFRNGHFWVVYAFAKMIEDKFIFHNVESINNYLLANKLVYNNSKKNNIHDVIIDFNL
jgi:Lipase